MPASRVSVVVRSIGRATLARALSSIALQDGLSAEVVIVAASGASHAPVPALCGRFPVVPVRSARPLARAEAADAGIRAATGEWITFVDDDDELLPGHLDGLLAAAAGMPDARAVNGRALATFLDGRTEVWGQRFATIELYERNFVHLSTLLFHRSLLDAGIAFDRSLPIHEDWDFALQVAQHTRFADWPQPTFRWNADAGTSGAGGGRNADDAAFARHRDAVYAKWSARFRDHAERCRAHLARAAALASAGNLEGAVSAARDVLAISQNDPHALNLLAMLAMRSGNVGAALRDQALAVEVRPRDADLQYNLALVRGAAGDPVGARLALEAVLRLDPDHGRARSKLRELATSSFTHAAAGGTGQQAPTRTQ